MTRKDSKPKPLAKSTPETIDSRDPAGWREEMIEEMAGVLGAEAGRQFTDAAGALVKHKIPEEAVNVCLAMITCLALGWDFDEYTKGKDYRYTGRGVLLENARAGKRLGQLRRRLDGIEELPENEAVRFQLESEIYRLEHPREVGDEWPEFIRAEKGGAR